MRNADWLSFFVHAMNHYVVRLRGKLIYAR